MRAYDIRPESREKWKTPAGWDDCYQVSTFGRVRCIKHTQVRMMRPQKASNLGHLKVALSKNGERAIRYLVHRLVLFTFVGPPPEGMECAHLNGAPWDNRLNNLKWVTRKENESHKALHGTRLTRDRHHNAKLSTEQVREMVKLRNQGHRSPYLAKHFGVTKTTVCRILADSTCQKGKS